MLTKEEHRAKRMEERKKALAERIKKLQAYTEDSEIIKKKCEELNQKRLPQFLKLVKLSLCLYDDRSIANEFLKDGNIAIDEDDINKLKKEFPTREKIAEEFNQLLSEMKNDLVGQTDAFKEKYELDEHCCSAIYTLGDLALNDFKINNNPDIMKILIDNKLSPITKHGLPSSDETEHNKKYNEKHDKAAKVIGGAGRSFQRIKKHFNIFEKKPSFFSSVPYKSLPFADEDSKRRLMRIILELTNACAIINPEDLNHWTTKGNLEKINMSGFFYGNEILQALGVFFRKNALVASDIANGDFKSICFGPFEVDPIAWSRDHKIKENLVTIKVDINKVETYGKANQFFKLIDLCSPPFTSEVRITDQFKFKVERKPLNKEFLMTLTLGEESVEIPIYDAQQKSKHDMLCYGDVYSFNRFSLTSIFTTLNKCSNEEFKNKFLNYLMSLEDNEIKKALTIMGQTITLYSEYNFNAALKHTNKLITKIHDVDKSLTYDLSEVPSDRYNQVINDIVRNKPVDVPIIKEILLSVDPVNPKILHCGPGVTVDGRNVKFEDRDWSRVSSKYFNGEHPVNTLSSPDKGMIEEQLEARLTTI